MTQALIIGAGIAGPVMAMALQRAGVDSVVYEAYSSPAEDVGAFLTVASNGLDALRTLDAHGLVVAAGFPTPYIRLSSGNGKQLGHVRIGGYSHWTAGDAEPGTYEMVFGRRAFFGYTIAPTGEIWWFANVPSADPLSPEQLAVATSGQWNKRLVDLFAVDACPATEIIRSTAGRLVAANLYDLPSVPTWRSDRMVVVGDAAHATSPSSGQGASMAIEDAVVLAKCLRDSSDCGQAFAAFEQLRRERVERIVAYGARMSSTKAGGVIARLMRDLFLPRILERAASHEATAWMYDHHIDWDTPAEPGQPVASRRR